MAEATGRGKGVTVEAGMRELMSELDRNGNPRRMVSIKDLRELLAAVQHENTDGRNNDDG